LEARDRYLERRQVGPFTLSFWRNVGEEIHHCADARGAKRVELCLVRLSDVAGLSAVEQTRAKPVFRCRDVPTVAALVLSACAAPVRLPLRATVGKF
jgi:hypothetical protein